MAQLIARVLAAEPDSEAKTLLDRLLAEENLETHFAATAEQAFKRFQAQHFDLVICEINFGPGQPSGLDILKKIREVNSQIPVILIADAQSMGQAAEAINLGVTGFLVKPLNQDEVRETIYRAIRSYRARFNRNELVNYQMNSVYEAVIKSTEASTLKLLETVDNLIELVYPEEYGSFPDLKMAIYEALSNAVEHGNRRKKERNIFFQIELKMDRIMVHIKDEGDGFDTNRFFSLRKGAGMHRGLRLIDHLMDEISFNIKGNEINLLKILAKRDQVFV